MKKSTLRLIVVYLWDHSYLVLKTRNQLFVVYLSTFWIQRYFICHLSSLNLNLYNHFSIKTILSIAQLDILKALWCVMFILNMSPHPAARILRPWRPLSMCFDLSPPLCPYGPKILVCHIMNISQDFTWLDTSLLY